jgi:UTP--glucose-1-phosphate uridylyltransferase
MDFAAERRHRRFAGQEDPMSTTAPARKVRKAVLPVAGLGMGLLPATRSVPKALLPIVDKPLVEFAVDEAAAAGIEQVIFVTPRHGSAVEDHFANWRGASMGRLSFASVRQPEPRGVGHALGCAEALLDGEAFAVLLPDELILDRDSGIGPCIDLHERTGHSVVATEPITMERTSTCGVVATEARDGRIEITHAIDRPGPAHAPSLTGIVGRLVLTPAIFAALRDTEASPSGELRLTDALHTLLGREPVYAFDLPGRRIDCGARGGILEAVLEVAWRDPDLAPLVMHWRQARADRAPGVSLPAQATSKPRGARPESLHG